MGYVGNQTTNAYSSMDKQTITGNGGASYTLTHAVANAQEIEVFVNNVRQEAGVAYTVAGTALSMTGNVASTDDFYVIYQGKALQTVVPPDGSVTSAKLVYPLTTFSSTGIDDNATSTAMTLDSSGNVALNNASYLQFKDSGGTARDVLTIDAYNGLNINSAGGGASAPIVFKENGSEIARFDSSGNLLVGTTSNPTSNRVNISFDNSTVGGMRFSHASSSYNQSAIEFYNAASSRVGYIYSNASSTTYSTSSDYRLKENVTDITGATERLKQLNPVRFNFIADADTTVDGFLAHEVQDVVPEAISGTKDAVDDDGNPEYQGIDQSKLVPLLVATIQELEARIAALESA